MLFLKLHVAGNILPAVSRDFGSILVGNIIPESISDGKNINCDTIVSFDVVLDLLVKWNYSIKYYFEIYIIMMKALTLKI